MGYAKYNYMKKNWIKYILTFLSIILFRLLPFRVPNVEPIMAVIMPLSKTYVAVMAFVFGASSMVLFDLITSGIGIWTFFTALCYGLIGLSAYWFLRGKQGWKGYTVYAIISTLAFDIITGVLVGPIFYNQPWISAIVGQIPFTIYHLIGNISFALLLSPVFEYWFNKEERIVINNKLIYNFSVDK